MSETDTAQPLLAEFGLVENTDGAGSTVVEILLSASRPAAGTGSQPLEGKVSLQWVLLRYIV